MVELTSLLLISCLFCGFCAHPATWLIGFPILLRFAPIIGMFTCAVFRNQTKSVLCLKLDPLAGIPGRETIRPGYLAGMH